jgi:hydrogenase maturation protease
VTSGALVIGYGNTLRGDDGIGPAVAEAIVARALPGVRVVVVHQLTPELAPDLAGCRRAVFVDAAATGEAVTVTPLTDDAPAPSLAHAADPRGLLALARAAYGRGPEAWLVAVPGADFGYRDGLSEVGRERARSAASEVERLLRQ